MDGWIYLCIYIIIVLLLFAIFGYELLVTLFLSLIFLNTVRV